MSTKITLRKTSLVDYPGRVSTVIFFRGCNLRCPWCHNPQLVSGGGSGLSNAAESFLDAADGLAHARKRKAVLGGVVLSGGEPCLWEGLPDYIREIKKLNIPVKLDTNGMFPAMLEKIFGREDTRPDYIALDLKLAPERYGELLPMGGETITAKSKRSPAGARNLCGHQEKNGACQRGVFDPGEALRRSAALISESGIAHEYRSLALPAGFMSEDDVEALAPLVDSSPWHFRLFKGGNCLDPAWNNLEEGAEEARARAAALTEKAKALGKNALSG